MTKFLHRNTVNIIQNVENFLRSLVWPVTLVTVHNGSLRSIMGLHCVFQGLKQSDPTNRERESRPISIQRPKEMISDSVELCETEVCFIQIQLTGTNV